MAISTSDLPLLHSLTSEWTVFTDDPTHRGIAPTVRDLGNAGLVEFDGNRARRTEKGAKYMRKSRVATAESAFRCFCEGVSEAVAGEHVPTWQELYDGYTIIDPKRARCADKTRAGEVSVKAGRVFAREAEIGAGYEPTVDDFYKGYGLTNAAKEGEL